MITKYVAATKTSILPTVSSNWESLFGQELIKARGNSGESQVKLQEIARIESEIQFCPCDLDFCIDLKAIAKVKKGQTWSLLRKAITALQIDCCNQCPLES